ncbi:hypothetical protein PG997_006463 [Apiospora hydei]|uniref:AA1-like domain-containing protein n=1 Tax=Apiospora hydei TaxID=1337664 RepID=A0ABR1WQ98_9PEZI
MQISTLLFLAGSSAAAATALPRKNPGWAYEVYYWNISNWRTAELAGEVSRYHYVFDISAPVFDPPSVYGAPSTPSFTGTCEGESTAESPNQTGYIDCTASRQVGDTSDGGTFGGLSARVQPSPKYPKPDVAISFQWTQEMSNQKYNVTGYVAPLWAVGQPNAMGFDILDSGMLWERWV